MTGRGRASDLHPSPDPRLELVLSESLRQIERQEANVDDLRARAGTVLATAALAASFLGAATYGQENLSDGGTAAVIVAMVALAAVLGCVLLILWPRDWKWLVQPSVLLTEWVDGDKAASLDDLRRDLAIYLERAHKINQGKLNHLWLALEIASGAVVIEVAAWIIALGVR